MKLYYFDIYGRAESIRFLLSHAKVEYENVNAGPIMADLKKDKLEFGQVPLLETADGHSFVQSWAILRYLGRTYGYYPNEAELAWKIDSTIDAVEDYLAAYFKFNFESNEEKKAIFKENWLKNMPIWVSAIEKRLEANGGKYIAGDKITIADFALGAVAFNLLLNEANPHYAETMPFIKDHEVLKKYANGLKEDLGAHLSTRPTPRPF
jgi:glutathione S-transferase